MVLGSLLVPLLDTAAKLLGEDHAMPAGQIAFARFALQTLMVLPLVILVEGFAGLKCRHPGLNLLRGVLLAGGTICFFIALKAMPLADAVAIFFVEPMIVTLLSVVFLREAIDIRRIVAVVVGFGGALLVIRPNFTALGAVALLPLLCAVFVSIYAVLGRHLSAATSSITMHFYAGIGGLATISVVMIAGAGTALAEFQTVAPSGWPVWGLLLMLGFVATVAHLMFIQAYRLTPATLLAPFGYMEIVSATLFSILFFGDVPDAVKWLGIAVITASGLGLVWVDRAATSSGSQPPEPI
ncbi:DMT family transporter [Aureimonas sp. Leaf454]|uniref:DMT family transporter n=1 Tax=Aureimonas sp. Leaf454 TaxID=1736381 RepID=UPI000AF3019B|nr:DMT family transporter [Aureimonas sp. Leaf454]